MGRIGLQLRATLENITRLRAEGQDFRWYLKLKCGNCGEVSEKWQYLRLMDSAPLKGGRGSATMVQKCKLCSRENSIEPQEMTGTFWTCSGRQQGLLEIAVKEDPSACFVLNKTEDIMPLSWFRANLGENL
ncbi:CXXC motif containing zinc binding protein isoform X3 [Poecile atricapillus]|uniref:CXXC motif containing zinc binding protein isoform X3 n=1 Tax=Poecile atricapillus TaxID=48891 RepID=UPI002738ED89|nr:CXXC motif containing zinc binding protein isoform X3 [Poecile atricapillus]